MKFYIKYKEEEHELGPISIFASGCTSPGDVIQLGDNLFKVEGKTGNELKVSFHKKVEKGPRSQTRK